MNPAIKLCFMTCSKLLEAGANVLWDVEFVSFFSLSARHSAQMILERSGCEWSLISINPHRDGSVCVRV
jgi:hypothetical protein